MKYNITGNKFEGRIQIWYDDGKLQKLSFEDASLTLIQKDWFLRILTPMEALINILRQTKEKETGKHMFTIIEEIEVVTFEMFYNHYGYREAKQKALKAWEKLSVADQISAYKFVNKYKGKIAAAGTAMAYPASYLNAKRWKD